MTRAAELKAQIELERRGEPFLLFRSGEGEQRLFELEPRGVAADDRPARGGRASRWRGTRRCRGCTATIERVGRRLGPDRRRAVAQRLLRQRRADARPPPARGRRPPLLRRDRGPLPRPGRRPVVLDRVAARERPHDPADADPAQGADRALPARSTPRPSRHRRRTARSPRRSSSASTRSRPSCACSSTASGSSDLPQNQKRARLAASTLVGGLLSPRDF